MTYEEYESRMRKREEAERYSSCKFYCVECKDIDGNVHILSYVLGWENALAFTKDIEESDADEMEWIEIRGAYIDPANGLLNTDIDNEELYFREFNNDEG